MNFEVRKATFQDLPMLAVMAFRLHEEIRLPLTEQQERYVQAFLMNQLMSGALFALVAVTTKRKKERVIGMVTFDIRMSETGVLQAWGNNLYVDKEFRGGKVAKRLIEEGLKIADASGAKVAYVETEIPALFERYGFTQDHVVVKKAL